MEPGRTGVTHDPTEGGFPAPGKVLPGAWASLQGSWLRPPQGGSRPSTPAGAHCEGGPGAQGASSFEAGWGEAAQHALAPVQLEGVCRRNRKKREGEARTTELRYKQFFRQGPWCWCEDSAPQTRACRCSGSQRALGTAATGPTWASGSGLPFLTATT